jgi:hypothetical protein
LEAGRRGGRVEVRVELWNFRAKTCTDWGRKKMDDLETSLGVSCDDQDVEDFLKEE